MSPATAKPEYDPTFTDRVIAATGPKAHKRLAEIMPSLCRHLHDFAREVDLTVSEWLAAVEMVNRAGQMSNDQRNENQLVCDVFGLETLVDEITSKLLSRSHAYDTPSAILGPFYRHNPPELPNGSNIVSIPDGVAWAQQARDDFALVKGRVLDASTGKPIVGATVDAWHNAPNGLYEQQDPEQPDMNLRGRFTTDTEGNYSFYGLRPVSYPIPHDGPAGEILELLDRHPYRPGHIHFYLRAPGYRPLVTQVFDSTNPYLVNDSVFAVKEALIVEFKPVQGKEHRYELDYNFHLGPMDDSPM